MHSVQCTVYTNNTRCCVLTESPGILDHLTALGRGLSTLRLDTERNVPSLMTHSASLVSYTDAQCFCSYKSTKASMAHCASLCIVTINAEKVHFYLKLKAASTDLFNPLVPQVYNSECQNILFPSHAATVK